MIATSQRPADLAGLALVRTAGYALLARALAYPDEAAHRELQEVAARSHEALTGTPLAHLVGLARTGTRDELESSFVRLFTVSASPDCPLFETAFLATDHLQQTSQMADIAGFYRAFGVDTASPGFRPDDLTVELEFMGFLCRKEADAREHLGAPRTGQVVRAQREFLASHLACWGTPLGRRIAIKAMNEQFYFAAGEALSDWLTAECEALNTGPIDYADTPAMEWDQPGADSDDLADSDDSDLISFDEIEVM